jgi:hypothetical protein
MPGHLPRRSSRTSSMARCPRIPSPTCIKSKLELREPTIAREMPMRNRRRNSFSMTNPSRGRKAHLLLLNIPQLAHLGLFSRSTQGSRRRSFTHGFQLAFGKGCDRSSYVNPFYQLDLTRATSNTAFD